MTASITEFNHALSAIIVTYNSADEIGPCLHSLIPEMVKCDGEIIIVDNASTDESLAKIWAEVGEFADIRVIENKLNVGFSLGNNQGFDAATGKHLLILNPDTVLQPGAIKKLLETLGSDDSLGAVAPQLLWPDGGIQRSCRRFPNHWDVITNATGLNLIFPRSPIFNAWKMGDFDHDSTREVDQPAAAALLVRGSVLRALNGFDHQFPMFFSDVDLCRRIKNEGFKILFTTDARVVHLGGSTIFKNRTTMIISSHISFFRYLEKYYDRLHQQIFNLIAGLVLYFGLVPRLVWHWLGLAMRFRRKDSL